MDSREKIVLIEHLTALVVRLKGEGKRIVTTNGTFDILHVGHKRALERSRSLGDVLIVGVNSDTSVKQYKSEGRPIIPERDRVEMLAGLVSVDYVTIFTERDPRHFLNMVKPDVHTKSGDYTVETLIEAPTVQEHGGEIVIIPLVPGKSTSAIIDRIMGSKRSHD